MDNNSLLISKFEVGFWRIVGYIISILLIIGSFIFAIPTYGISIIGAILGFIFIWMLKKSARDERIEKHLRNMDPYYKDQKISEDLANEKRKLDADEKYLAEIEKKKIEKEKHDQE